MTRHSVPASMVGSAMGLLLISLSAALATEVQASLPSVAQEVFAKSVEPASGSPALPASGSVSLITGTLPFISFLPIIFRSPPSCAVGPTLIAPANGSNLNTLIPTLEWDAGIDPTGTRTVLEVAKDFGFTEVRTQLWDNRGQGTDRYQFSSNLNPATILYWRAHLECGSALQSPYSPIWSFVTGYGGIILPAPALVAPSNGSSLSSTSPNLQWLEVVGATQYLVSWQKVGSGMTNTYRVSGTQYAPVLDPAATYLWWINAQNDYALGATSATWQLTTPSGAFRYLPEHFRTFATHDGLTTKSQQ